MGTRVSLVLLAASIPAFADNWPDFRGTAGQGHSRETGLPLTWGESTNVRWKAKLPGVGWSTPIVIDDQVWLTTATEANTSLRLLRVNARTGETTADIELFRLTEPVKGQAKNSGASPSVVVENDRVYAHFGAYGTAAVQRDGKVLWKTQDLKYFQANGPGSSPILFGDLLILNCDGNDAQFVVALDKNTGKIVWRKSRPSNMSYATSLVIQTASGPQMVSPGAHRTISYDPKTGAELWFVSYGDQFSNVPRPIFGHDLVYICTGFYQPELLAVRTEGRGDVTKTHVAWRYGRGVSLTPSPILVGEQIYMVSDNGILTSLNAKTGQEVWRQRLSGNFSASPIYADGRIYFLSEEGETTVIAPGKDFRKLAANKLEGRFLASIAVSGGGLFVRSDTHLYRIEQPAK